MSKRSDEHSLKRFLMARELNRRAGGDIDKILPAMDDMLNEAAEKRKQDEDANKDEDFAEGW